MFQLSFSHFIQQLPPPTWRQDKHTDDITEIVSYTPSWRYQLQYALLYPLKRSLETFYQQGKDQNYYATMQLMSLRAILSSLANEYVSIEYQQEPYTFYVHIHWNTDTPTPEQQIYIRRINAYLNQRKIAGTQYFILTS